MNVNIKNLLRNVKNKYGNLKGAFLNLRGCKHKLKRWWHSRICTMPLYFSSHIELVTWEYIPDEVLDFGPFINNRVLIISRPETQMLMGKSRVIIPSLKVFRNTTSVSILFSECYGITDWPDMVDTIELINTSISSLGHLPNTIKHLRLHNNPLLQLTHFPDTLVKFIAFYQSFDTLIVNPSLIMLTLVRCTVTRLSGLLKCNRTLFSVLDISSCIGPYHNFNFIRPVVDDNPEQTTDILLQILNEIYRINRQMYIDDILPLVHIRTQAIKMLGSSASNALRVVCHGSNYPRRIGEFYIDDDIYNVNRYNYNK